MSWVQTVVKSSKLGFLKVSCCQFLWMALYLQKNAKYIILWYIYELILFQMFTNKISFNFRFSLGSQLLLVHGGKSKKLMTLHIQEYPQPRRSIWGGMSIQIRTYLLNPICTRFNLKHTHVYIWDKSGPHARVCFNIAMFSRVGATSHTSWST